jgi:hypothetical protein
VPSLAATARCLAPGCPWTAEGDPETADKAAARHTEKPPKHPTATETRWTSAR